MDLKRLFHVLVVGGSVAAGCERSRTGGLTVADAAAMDVGMSESAPSEAPIAAEDAAASDVAAGMDATDGPKGDPCLCSPTKCCELHDGGPATVQAGMYCCWGTTC